MNIPFTSPMISEDEVKVSYQDSEAKRQRGYEAEMEKIYHEVLDQFTPIKALADSFGLHAELITFEEHHVNDGYHLNGHCDLRRTNDSPKYGHFYVWEVVVAKPMIKKKIFGLFIQSSKSNLFSTWIGTSSSDNRSQDGTYNISDSLFCHNPKDQEIFKAFCKVMHRDLVIITD